MRTYKEKFDYELNKMDSREAQKKFFSGAINRMKMGCDEYTVNDQKEFACDVLCHCGFCLHVDCRNCILEANYLRALEEIKMGVRTPIRHSRISYKSYNSYIR